MTSKLRAAPMAFAFLMAAAAPALAEDSTEPIYGQELMTAQEQQRYRARLGALSTDDERRALRANHRSEMQVRARERGVEAPIYGHGLMTQEERQRHRSKMQALGSDRERSELRARHRSEMQARAQARREKGSDVAAPSPHGAGMVRGRDLMTEEERQRHREEIRSKTTPEERERVRREKHEEMKERARDQGVQLPDEPLPHGRGKHR